MLMLSGWRRLNGVHRIDQTCFQSRMLLQVKLFSLPAIRLVDRSEIGFGTFQQQNGTDYFSWRRRAWDSGAGAALSKLAERQSGVPRREKTTMLYPIDDSTPEAKKARALLECIVKLANIDADIWCFFTKKVIWGLSLYLELGSFQVANWSTYPRISDAARQPRALGLDTPRRPERDWIFDRPTAHWSRFSFRLPQCVA
jgi:hypothetical protein